jgi:hypothetical protein
MIRATQYIGQIRQDAYGKPFYVFGVDKEDNVQAIPSERSGYLIHLAPWGEYTEGHPTKQQYRNMIKNAFDLI